MTNLPGTYAPSRADSRTRKGESVYRFMYSRKRGVCSPRWNSLRMTWPIASASAPSVPGWTRSHSSANFVLSA